MSLDTDPLAGTDDRAAVLDVDLHMDVIAALTTRSQDDFVLVVLADLQAEGARRRNAADERRLADEHRTGLAHVEEGLLGLGDGLGPTGEHMHLAGELHVLVNIDLGLGPFHVVPVQRAHAQKGLLRTFAVSAGGRRRRQRGRRDGSRQSQGQRANGARPQELGKSFADGQFHFFCLPIAL
jgi:hypothetical protein